jgi:hypothetical protein
MSTSIPGPRDGASRSKVEWSGSYEAAELRLRSIAAEDPAVRPRRVSSMATSIPGVRDGAAQPNVGWNGPNGTYEAAAGPNRREVRLRSWRRCTGTADDGAVSVCIVGHCFAAYQPPDACAPITCRSLRRPGLIVRRWALALSRSAYPVLPRYKAAASKKRREVRLRSLRQVQAKLTKGWLVFARRTNGVSQLTTPGRLHPPLIAASPRLINRRLAFALSPFYRVVRGWRRLLEDRVSGNRRHGCVGSPHGAVAHDMPQAR